MTYNKKLCYYESEKIIPYEKNKELNKALERIELNEIITHFHLDSLETIHLVLLNLTNVTIPVQGKISIKINDLRDYFSGYKYPQSNLSEFIKEISSTLADNPSNCKYICSTNKWGRIHIISRNDNLYLGTSKGLIAIKQNIFRPKVLSNYYVTGLEFDFEGGLWCSTLKNGIFYVPNPAITHYQTDQGHSIRSIIPQKDNLIFPLKKSGLNNLVLDTLRTVLKPYNLPLTGENIPRNIAIKGLKIENPVNFENIGNSSLGILQFPNEELFYFSNHGFTKQTRLTDKYLSHIDLSQYFIVKSEKNEYWFIKGISYPSIKMSNHNIGNESYKYPENFKVLKPLRLKNGKILLATTNGLFEINQGNKEIKSYPNFHTLTSNRVQDIIETRDESLVIATHANGLYIWKDSILTNISMSQGLLSNKINQLHYDSVNNSIWVATNNGLTKLTQNESRVWKSQSILTKNEGLSSQDIRAFQFYQNKLVFSNSKGVNVIPMKFLTPFETKPKLLLNNVLINNKIHEWNNELVLPFDSNNLKFQFHVISYKSQKDLILKYKLLPKDTIWQTSESKQLNFNSLQPGKYSIEVIALNFANIKSDPITINISITPPFWMTWWFYTLIISSGIFIVYYLSSKSIQIYKNQAKFQKSLKEMHVVSLQSKMNPHFIFNSLNSIQNYILKNEKMKANEYLLEFSTLIRAILQNSEHTSITLFKELETLRMYVELEKKRIRKEFQYVEKIDPEIDVNLCTIPTLLIQPYIENAIWHGKVYTNTQGEIKVCICKKNESLHFEISDNGIGIENAEKSKVRVKGYKSIGSEATKKRIQLLSELNNDITEVKISKRDSNNEVFPGTVITFSVPYKIQTHSGEEI